MLGLAVDECCLSNAAQVLKLEQCAAEAELPGLAMDDFVRPFPNVFPIQNGTQPVVWDEAQTAEIAAGGFDMSKLGSCHASAFYFGLQMPSAPKPQKPAAGAENGAAAGEGEAAAAAAAAGAVAAAAQQPQQQAQHGNGYGAGFYGQQQVDPNGQPQPRQLDIGFVVQEFSKELRQWAHWDASAMAISFQVRFELDGAEVMV